MRVENCIFINTLGAGYAIQTGDLNIKDCYVGHISKELRDWLAAGHTLEEWISDAGPDTQGDKP